MKEVSPQIRVYPPGPNTRQLILDDRRVITHSTSRQYPLSVKSGQGCLITDLDDNAYIDFTSADLCTSLGHSHPAVVEAVRTQASQLISYPYTLSYHPLIVELAETLIRMTGGAAEKRVYFGTGTEDAVETAVKIAEWHTRNYVLLSVTGSYFGETSVPLALSSDRAFRKRHYTHSRTVHHIPSPYCYRCPFQQTPRDCRLRCLSYLEEEILEKVTPPENVAAVLFEPIMVRGGCITPPDGYFLKLKQIADKNGILTIDNEADTCMGRTGSWFAISHWRVHPDVLVVSNSFAEGLPLSAVISQATVIDWAKNSHSTTLGGNLLACTAAKTAIEVLKKEHLLENANREGMYIRKRITELQERLEKVGDVRGKGLLTGVELVKSSSKDSAEAESREVAKKCWRRGLLVKVCGVSTIQLTPPLTVTRGVVDRVLEILDGVFHEVLG